MRKILVFGGTTEGRELVEQVINLGFLVEVCVASDYGKSQLTPCEQLKIHTGRLDIDQMKTLMLAGDFSIAIDSTHPYATVVTQNIITACEMSNLQYLRLQRPKSDISGCEMAESIADACKKVVEGNILATTGSKEILPYKAIENFKERVFLRMLPMEEAVNQAVKQGFAAENIIGLKGPFTLEQNIEHIKKFNIKTLITKDGGDKGGFSEKIKAANICEIKAIVVSRPEEKQGKNFEEVLQILKEMKR